MSPRPNASRIFVVDPNRNSALLLMRRLEAWGYTVEIASSPEEAILQLQLMTSPPALVLVEVLSLGNKLFDLPKLAAESTKWGPSQVPYVAHSVLSDKASVVKAIQNGYKDYIVRPMEPELLRDRIKTLAGESKELSAETFRYPYDFSTKAYFEVQLHELNEFGIQASCETHLPEGTVVQFSAPLFKELDIDPVHVRVASCAKSFASSVPEYRLLLQYVGLGPDQLKSIRGACLRGATKRAS